MEVVYFCVELSLNIHCTNVESPNNYIGDAKITVSETQSCHFYMLSPFTDIHSLHSLYARLQIRLGLVLVNQYFRQIQPESFRRG